MAKVGIVMGSDSDLKVMSKAADMLEELGIEYELTIISAHREPDELIEWTRGAEERDVKVIIAGAGMAAALPGMCAALFALPVIGVPLSGKNLDGMDAVFSIMQMPPGVPVATVAIDGAKNAAILAAKMPILIAEKTGPHFAVGDTCYTYDEDNMTYNPDGKAIIARDNSVSIRRKEDISKAYFNCHTDITIPYDELGAITVIRHDGSTCDIIRDGRFVLEGVEELNKPLDTLDAESK